MARTAPPQRSEFAAFQPVQTRWHDNDAYGHMNNAVYYALFDTAMSNWQLAQGLSLTGPDATRFVVVESGCRFLSEVGFPDSLEIGLRLGRIGSSSLRYDMAMFRAGSDIAAAAAFFAMVHIGDDSRPEPLTPDLRRLHDKLRTAETE